MNPSRFVVLIQVLLFALFCVVFTAITFKLTLSKFLRNLGYSKYFVEDGMAKRLLQYEADEYKKAFDYLRGLNGTRRKFHVNDSQPTISIIIPTTKRVASHYIIRVVARIIHEYSLAKTNIREIIVVNNDKSTETYDDVIFLKKIVRVIDNTKIRTNVNFLFKQCNDMTSVLTYGIDTNSDYILVLEDDGLPVKGFFKRLENIIIRHLATYDISRVALVKLYYPDKWYGYELNDIIEILFISIIPASIITILLFNAVSKCTMLKTKTIRILSSMLFIYLVICFTVFLYSFGRVHLIELLRYCCPSCQRLLTAPRCCTPAVLYPRHFAISLQKNIRCTSDYPYDFALDDTVQRMKLKQFLVFPNMIVHIGFQSSAPHKQNKVSEYMFLLEN